MREKRERERTEEKQQNEYSEVGRVREERFQVGVTWGGRTRGNLKATGFEKRKRNETETNERTRGNKVERTKRTGTKGGKGEVFVRK